MLIIGIDEAGYGPNLGPLVISASCWELPRKNVRKNRSPELELVERLRRSGAVTDSLKDYRNGKGLLAITDSKKLYTSSASFSLLEKPVLHFLELAEHDSLELFAAQAWTWRRVFEILAPESFEETMTLPWNKGYDKELPNVEPERMRRLKASLESENIAVPKLAAKVIHPRGFNAMLRQHESKATAHVHEVLDLARTLVYGEAMLRNECDVLVLCDKLGARNRYAEFLRQYFFAETYEILGESTEESVYLLTNGKLRLEIRFCVRGERLLPIALASITSKYLRELAMGAWNEFWCSRIKGLQPTAGYPVDAKRFRDEIETMRKKLQIEMNDIWREK